MPLSSPVPWLRHHPREWRAGTVDREGLTAAADALAARPGFEAAIRRFADGWQQGYDATPVLGSVMRNNARYVLLLACLWLDHQREPEQPDIAITPTRLLAFFERLDHRLVEGGASRIKVILGHVRAAGLLRPSTGAPDGRQRPLEPTPLLRQALAGYLRGFLGGIGSTLPLPAAPATMCADPVFVAELFSYRMQPLLHERWSINQGLPALTWVTNREKGYPQLLALARTMEVGADGLTRVHGVPQAIAERVGISRGTVRNFIVHAEQQGWIVPEASHRWHLQPAFRAELMQWMGREFLWMHALAVAAWGVTGGGGGAGGAGGAGRGGGAAQGGQI